MGIFKFRHSGRRQRKAQEAAEEQLRIQNENLRIFNENLNRFKTQKTTEINKFIDEQINQEKCKNIHEIYEKCIHLNNLYGKHDEMFVVKLELGVNLIDDIYDDMEDKSDILNEFMDLLTEYSSVNVRGSIDCAETLSLLLSENYNISHYSKLSSYLDVIYNEKKIKTETHKFKQFDELLRNLLNYDKDFAEYHKTRNYVNILEKETKEYRDIMNEMRSDIDEFKKIQNQKLDMIVSELEKQRKAALEELNKIVSQEQYKANKITNDNINLINENLQKQIKSIKKAKTFSIINSVLTVASFGSLWYLNAVSSSVVSISLQRSLLMTGIGSFAALVKGVDSAGIQGQYSLNDSVGRNIPQKNEEIKIKEELINKKYEETLKKVSDIAIRKENKMRYPSPNRNLSFNQNPLNRGFYDTIMINVGSVLHNEYVDMMKFIYKMTGSKKEYLQLKNTSENDRKTFEGTPVSKSNVGSNTRTITKEVLNHTVPLLKEFRFMRKLIPERNDFVVSDKQLKHIYEKHSAGSFNLNKSTFYGEPSVKIKEITDFITKNKVKPLEVNGNDIYIIRSQNSGRSGLANQLQNQDYITIIAKKGTKNIISAHPSDGTPSKIELRTYYSEGLSLF